MVHAVEKGAIEAISRAMPAVRSSGGFEDVLQSAARPASQPATSSETNDDAASVLEGEIRRGIFGTVPASLFQKASQPAATAADSAEVNSQTASPDAQTKLGDPDVQAWLNSTYAEQGAANPFLGVGGISAATSFLPADGAATKYQADSIYGPDQIYAQALANQVGNAYAAMTGENPASFTSQLPGIPSVQAQQMYDKMLAHENALKLESGQPIDTAAYWSDPGPLTINGHTYSAKELGYAGAAQSSGPEPIYISQSNQVAGTNTFTVPGYTGTVSGIQPGRYYTLQQLEQAGLPTGQPDAQIYPGSWSEVQNS